MKRLHALLTRISKTRMLHIIISLGVLATAFVFSQSITQPAAKNNVKKQTVGRAEYQLARMSDEVSIKAAGRGAPYINLSDGRDLITSYSGPDKLVQALESNQAQPRSLASADFDEDGVPDLVAGYEASDGGIIVLHRGNVDSIYPNSPEAQQRRAEGTFTEAPFLSPGFVFSVAEAAGFIGAGDFDGDGHWDVVAAKRGGDRLYLLSGDGRGGLKQSKQIEQAGKITALTVGEINRRDGLDDVIVGVTANEGAKVLVYEGPEGALRARPEEFSAPEEVTSLALGQLDSEYTYDLAVASGKNLLLVHGRDRKLSLDPERQADVAAAKVVRRRFDFEIASLTIGDFSGKGTDIALLAANGQIYLIENMQEGGIQTVGIGGWSSTSVHESSATELSQLVRIRTSSLPLDNLLIVNPLSEQLQIICSARAGQKTVSLVDSLLSIPHVLSATLEVDDRSIAVLPMMINSDALSDLVVMKRGVSRPSSVITKATQTFIVTNTNDSGPGSLRQAIIEANASIGVDNLVFRIESLEAPMIIPLSPLPAITDALILDGTSQAHGKVELKGNNAGNGSHGLTVLSGNCRVRGLVINGFVSANTFRTYGILLSNAGGNIIEDNFIGTDSTGLVSNGNIGGGIGVFSARNTIGGSVSKARNVISENRDTQVTIDGTNATENQIKGNFIGTNANGNQSFSVNAHNGIEVSGQSAEIGSATSGSGNVIAGCALGIVFFNESDGSILQGNFIGTDSNGTAFLGNSIGVNLNGPRITVGGTTEAARNIISGSSVFNILMASKSCKVQGNLLGTDKSGTVPVMDPNAFIGMGIFINNGSENVVGGATLGARNVISGNPDVGVSIQGNGTSNNQVQGNFIGVDITGAKALPNSGSGIYVANRAGANILGGTTQGVFNVVSGNDLDGIQIVGTESAGSVIQGNYIGVNSSGNMALSNGRNGISITQAPGVVIGGSSESAKNIVSGNRGHGVAIGIRIDNKSGGTGIILQGNYIGTDAKGEHPLGNTLSGIFVDADSVTNVIEKNIIAYNKLAGVQIPNNSNPGIKNTILSNLIFSNEVLGIDLGPLGVTANDDKDTDSGANELQNFPTLASTSLERSLNSLMNSQAFISNVTGTFNSTPNNTFTIEFFFGSNCLSSGNQYIGSIPIRVGSTQVTTDSNGNGTFIFSFSLPEGITGGWVNATATSFDGNTSEFSRCLQVGQIGPPPPAITEVRKSGKRLFVTGAGFVAGAQMFLNDAKQKKVTVNSATEVISKKAGNKVVAGRNRVKIINPDGTMSNEFIFDFQP